jgi:hypothetical protein
LQQYITKITGSKDRVAGKPKLESTNTGQCSLRGPDLCREIRESGKIDTEHGGIIGKLRTGKLHTITAIAGKFYYYVGKSFLFSGHEKKIWVCEVKVFNKETDKQNQLAS